MLKIKDVRKSFKDQKVLSNINLEVRRGEIVHIKGANGSGKSTLLKIISGLMEADGGVVEVDGDVYIGALIENPSFLENESAMYNLKFLYNLRNKGDYKHIVELLSKFELNPNDKKRISKYSVGMRQKVGIIQSIMENQNLVLLDEPTRGLDDKSIDTFVELINGLSLEGKSIIICSHDNIEGLNYSNMYEIRNHEIKNRSI